eukprot:sb/3461592/
MEGLDPGLLEHIPEEGATVGDRTSIWNNNPHLIAPNHGAVKRKEKKRLKKFTLFEQARKRSQAVPRHDSEYMRQLSNIRQSFLVSSPLSTTAAGAAPQEGGAVTPRRFTPGNLHLEPLGTKFPSISEKSSSDASMSTLPSGESLPTLIIGPDPYRLLGKVNKTLLSPMKPEQLNTRKWLLGAVAANCLAGRPIQDYLNYHCSTSTGETADSVGVVLRALDCWERIERIRATASASYGGRRAEEITNAGGWAGLDAPRLLPTYHHYLASLSGDILEVHLEPYKETRFIAREYLATEGALQMCDEVRGVLQEMMRGGNVADTWLALLQEHCLALCQTWVVRYFVWQDDRLKVNCAPSKEQRQYPLSRVHSRSASCIQGNDAFDDVIVTDLTAQYSFAPRSEQVWLSLFALEVASYRPAEVYYPPVPTTTQSIGVSCREDDLHNRGIVGEKLDKNLRPRSGLMTESQANLPRVSTSGSESSVMTGTMSKRKKLRPSTFKQLLGESHYFNMFMKYLSLNMADETEAPLLTFWHQVEIMKSYQTPKARKEKATSLHKKYLLPGHGPKREYLMNVDCPQLIEIAEKKNITGQMVGSLQDVSGQTWVVRYFVWQDDRLKVNCAPSKEQRQYPLSRVHSRSASCIQGNDAFDDVIVTDLTAQYSFAPRSEQVWLSLFALEVASYRPAEVYYPPVPTTTQSIGVSCREDDLHNRGIVGEKLDKNLRPRSGLMTESQANLPRVSTSGSESSVMTGTMSKRKKLRPSTFKQLLGESHYFNMFMKYLSLNMADETEAPLLTFWHQVEIMKSYQTPKARKEKATSLHKKYLLPGHGPKREYLMNVDCPQLIEIAEKKNITPAMIVNAQTYVCKILEDKWWAPYKTFLEDDASARIIESSSLDVTNTISCGQDYRANLRYQWGIFTFDLINFQHGLQDAVRYTQFKQYLRKTFVKMCTGKGKKSKDGQYFVVVNGVGIFADSTTKLGAASTSFGQVILQTQQSQTNTTEFSSRPTPQVG